MDDARGAFTLRHLQLRVHGERHSIVGEREGLRVPAGERLIAYRHPPRFACRKVAAGKRHVAQLRRAAIA
jgi:hypothetical protein